jgi:adenylate kinase
MAETTPTGPVRLLMLGPPGSGKGTQGLRLAQRYDARHVSTGDLLRAEVSAGSELGRQAQPYMDRGDLVPDELILEMVLEDVVGPGSPPSFVLDGFPRTVAQARTAYDQAVAADRVLHAAVCLDVADDELVSRLLQRGEGSGRADDTEETVRHRLTQYEQKTQPLLDFYGDRDILVRVDGAGDVDDVTARIVAALEPRLAAGP